MREIGRRTALAAITGMTTLPFITACDQAPFVPRSHLSEAPRPTEHEMIRSPGEGDIVIVDSKPFLLNNGKRYPLINSPEDFLQRSRGSEHGKKVFPRPSDQFKNL